MRTCARNSQHEPIEGYRKTRHDLFFIWENIKIERGNERDEDKNRKKNLRNNNSRERCAGTDCEHVNFHKCERKTKKKNTIDKGVPFITCKSTRACIIVDLK